MLRVQGVSRLGQHALYEVGLLGAQGVPAAHRLDALLGDLLS